MCIGSRQVNDLTTMTCFAGRGTKRHTNRTLLTLRRLTKLTADIRMHKRRWLGQATDIEYRYV